MLATFHTLSRLSRDLLLPTLCAAMLSGCGGGDDGPARFRLSGSVNFNGKPVPGGTIYFEPDVSKGNSGPAGSARIEDGEFDTADGKGVVGGPHVIRIEGFDGEVTDEKPFGNPIFVPHTVELDMPKEDGAQDLEVPAAAAHGLQVNPERV